MNPHRLTCTNATGPGGWGAVRRFALTFGVLVLGAPAAGWAQSAEPPHKPMRPLELLLQQSAALGLSTDQIERLDQIRARLTAANEPLVRRMMLLRAQWRQARRAARGGDGAQATARLEQIRATAEQIHSRIQRNHRMAMRAANRVLTPAQRAELAAIIEMRRKQQAAPSTGEPHASDRQ